MAIARDGSAPAFVHTGADAVTTASFTPPAGALLVAIAWHDTASGNTTNTSAITDSQGLTWTIKRTRNKADVSGQNGHLQVSIATVSSSTAMTVTTTGTNTGGYSALYVDVITGAHATQFDVDDETSNTGGVVTMTLTTVNDNSLAFLANIDWNAKAVPTAGSNVTQIVGAQPGGPNFTAWYVVRDAATSPAGSVTLNSTAPTTGNTNNTIAWAIRAATGGTSFGGSETFTLSESASVAISASPSDSGTFSDTSQMTASIGASDSGAMTDTSSMTGNIPGTDTGTLSEVSSVTVTIGATDTGTLSESSSQFVGGSGSDTGTLAESASLVVQVTATDSGVLSEVAINPNPGSAIQTLTYHLNRLAGTLVGNVPSRSAVDAANLWAGTAKLSLEDALNEKAGQVTPKWDVAGALNQLAGTSKLTPVDAISRIVS